MLIRHFDDRLDCGAKTAGVRRAVDHKMRERFGSVIRVIKAECLVLVRIGAAGGQLCFNCRTVSWCEDEHRAVILDKALRDISSDCMHEKFIVFVKLNEMVAIADGFEVAQWRDLPGSFNKG